jgi:hypothetical protein
VTIRDRELRPVIGHVGNGDMRIFELNEKFKLDDIDLLDDLEFFMNNDNQFYRRVYYPLLMKVKKMVTLGKPCDDKIFRSCIDQAIPLYIKKFNISGNEKSVFTDVDRDELARKIFGQEKERIEQGQYDRREE